MWTDLQRRSVGIDIKSQYSFNVAAYNSDVLLNDIFEAPSSTESTYDSDDDYILPDCNNSLDSIISPYLEAKKISISDKAKRTLYVAVDYMMQTLIDDFVRARSGSQSLITPADIHLVLYLQGNIKQAPYEGIVV
jgi:hypothetical protein